MKKVKKSWLLVLGLFALPVAYFSYVYAAYSYQTFKVSGNVIYDLWSDGSLALAGAFKSGNSNTGSGVTLPTITTGSNFAHWVPVFNPTASTIAAGSVLIATNSGVGYVQLCPAVTSTTTVVGIAAEAIAASTKGWMVPLGGGYAVVLSSGLINVGDVIVATAAAAGYVGKNNAPTTGTDLGVAVSSAPNGSLGSVLAILH